MHAATMKQLLVVYTFYKTGMSIRVSLGNRNFFTRHKLLRSQRGRISAYSAVFTFIVLLKSLIVSTFKI